MVEEFHGNGKEGGTWIYKQLYGWSPLNTNIWLPALSELVGIDQDQYWSTTGTYFSAMQGLNTSLAYWVDSGGGIQFSYFQQYNTSGGGQKTWEACNQQQALLRSTYCSHADQIWYLANQTAFYNTSVRTSAHAVHPAAGMQSQKELWRPVPILCLTFPNPAAIINVTIENPHEGVICARIHGAWQVNILALAVWLVLMNETHV